MAAGYKEVLYFALGIDAKYFDNSVRSIFSDQMFEDDVFDGTNKLSERVNQLFNPKPPFEGPTFAADEKEVFETGKEFVLKTILIVEENHPERIESGEAEGGVINLIQRVIGVTMTPNTEYHFTNSYRNMLRSAVRNSLNGRR